MDDVHQLQTAAKGANRPAEQVSPAEDPLPEPETVRVEPLPSAPEARVKRQEAASVRASGHLPERGTRYALISGLLMGVLVALVTIVLVLVNAGLFNEAHRQVARDALTVRVALLLAAIYGITWLVALIVAFIGGLILGRIAVRRRWAGGRRRHCLLAASLADQLYSCLSGQSDWYRHAGRRHRYLRGALVPVVGSGGSTGLPCWHMGGLRSPSALS
ncbi:MAG: hypothetical protein IMW90_15425 [Thermogemmatispora sp.]|uniref:hypothetical protein n=1 Tax=Thermogemmatispora sp. TaxID=1968838 RepID=UPI0019DC16A5|nr:hypothetical protein [Thermogemmatispora sp.]MBE3567108.1 hypothetical protein [Thermogemmatispora sp.]